MIPALVSKTRMAVFYSGGKDAGTKNDDVILTVAGSPFDLRSYRCRSFDNLRQVDPEAGFPTSSSSSKQRVLDAHNIDPPSCWVPLQTIQPYVASHKYTNMIGPRRLKARKKSESRFKRHTSPNDAFYQETSTITVNMTASNSCPENFYPIFLPMDQEYKAKYVMSNKKGKTLQEKVFLFLEHPCGWICFSYHFAV